MTHPLMERRALVCGSSQGIGLACAIELARLGATVTLVARDHHRLVDAKAKLPTPTSQQHQHLVADFHEPARLAKCVAEHIKSTGPCHILVNNTGGPPAGPLLSAEPDAFVEAMRMHVICNQLLVQAVVPGMKAQRFGRVINIISTSVITPLTGLGVSNTTRGAVANWGKTMAGELGPMRITVNNVLPGYTDTERLRSLLGKWAETQGTTFDDIATRSKELVPLRRFADPAEVGAVVAFLATPRPRGM